MKFTRALKSIEIKLMRKSRYIKYIRSLGTVIGEECDIDKSVIFGSEPWLIGIGNHTRVSHGVKFITHDGGIWVLRGLKLVDKKEVKYGRIVIGNNCNIGWNAIIMPNVVIGNNVIVAAGAVVTKSIPDNSIVGGIPARFIETIDEYYEKVRGKLIKTDGMTDEEKKRAIKDAFPDLLDFSLIR